MHLIQQNPTEAFPSDDAGKKRGVFADDPVLSEFERRANAGEVLKLDDFKATLSAEDRAKFFAGR